jgi:hypothetical protein
MMDASATFDAIAQRMAGEPDTDERRAFHNPCVRARGKIFAMLVRDELVLKLPAQRCAELVAAGAGRAFDRGQGRPLREWVTIGDPAMQRGLELAEEALTFARGA